MSGDIDWLKEGLLSRYKDSLAFQYAETIAERRGAEALTETPHLTVGTIHSVKGAEADHVILFPDLSGAAWKEMDRRKQGSRAPRFLCRHNSNARDSHSLRSIKQPRRSSSILRLRKEIIMSRIDELKVMENELRAQFYGATTKFLQASEEQTIRRMERSNLEQQHKTDIEESDRIFYAAADQVGKRREEVDEAHRKYLDSVEKFYIEEQKSNIETAMKAGAAVAKKIENLGFDAYAEIPDSKEKEDE